MTLTLFMGCVVGGPTTTYTPVSGVPSEPMTLNSVNRNWTGARAQVRYPFKFGKTMVAGGWTESAWVKSPEYKIDYCMLITERKSLKEVIPKKKLLVGTAVVCEGWSLGRPAKGKDLQVDFRFENYPAKARIVFKNKHLDDLPEVEKFLRLNVLKLYAQSEQLSKLGPETVPGMPQAGAPVQVPGPVRDAGLYLPVIEILSVSIQPARAKPGDQIDLIIHYRIEGIPEGAVWKVVEERSLYAGDSMLAEFKDVIDRSEGSYTSTKKVQVPASAQNGHFRFLAQVYLAKSDAEAIFEIY
jgi:hypothetical protein